MYDENKIHMKKPTKAEIAAQVKWLKNNREKVMASSIFGDNHQDAIDASIEVLKLDLSENEIEDRSHHEDEDESMQGDESLWAENVRSAAIETRNWLDGYESAMSPKDNFKDLVRK